MKYVLFVLIAYATLYVAVWFHEIGHSIFYFKYKLKDNWIKVNVKPYIFFSTPGNPDAEAWAKMTDK